MTFVERVKKLTEQFERGLMLEDEYVDELQKLCWQYKDAKNQGVI